MVVELVDYCLFDMFGCLFGKCCIVSVDIFFVFGMVVYDDDWYVEGWCFFLNVVGIVNDECIVVD